MLTHKLSLCTPSNLHPESQRLQQDLEKVQQLEGKITGELSSLKERVSTMESELHTYRDLDTLRHTAEERKKVTQNMSCNLYTAVYYMSLFVVKDMSSLWTF